MKTIKVTIKEIKAVKALMDEVDRLKEKNHRELGGGKTDYNGKEKIINYHEKKVQTNLKIMADLMGIDPDTVVDMCYDLVFAKYVLDDLKK